MDELILSSCSLLILVSVLFARDWPMLLGDGKVDRREDGPAKDRELEKKARPAVALPLQSLVGAALNNEAASTRYLQQLGERAATVALRAAVREIVSKVSEDLGGLPSEEAEDLYLRALVQLGLIECGRRLATDGFSDSPAFARGHDPIPEAPIPLMDRVSENDGLGNLFFHSPASLN